MLDLDLINGKTVDIKLDNKVVNVKEPKYSLVIKTKNFYNSLSECKDVVGEQNKILVEFLNNNSNCERFKEEDILNLSEKAVKALANLLIDTIAGVEENPN